MKVHKSLRGICIFKFGFPYITRTPHVLYSILNSSHYKRKGGRLGGREGEREGKKAGRLAGGKLQYKTNQVKSTGIRQ